MGEVRRRKLTPLGWATCAISLAVGILVLFIWIAPYIEEDPIGTMIRVITLLFVYGVALAVVVKLGGKRLSQG